ncbi:hypothetical protein KKF34_01585 [Myxococcota bacterium]|nr:hypothetical protein [Myxococcota bacterium]MBU1495550.1 hypothetical protein [Myxococcota bacterium]
MKKFSFLVLLSGVFAFSACGKDKKENADKANAKNKTAKAGKVASCNSPKYQTCKEYGEKNVEAAGIDFLKNLCGNLGDFKEVPCSTDKKIGSCKTLEGQDFYYEGYPIAVEKLKKQCDEKKGTWSN